METKTHRMYLHTPATIQSEGVVTRQVDGWSYIVFGSITGKDAGYEVRLCICTAMWNEGDVLTGPYISWWF